MQNDTAPPRAVTNSVASEVFIALRYWARLNAYDPSNEEKKLLTDFETRSGRQVSRAALSCLRNAHS